MEENQLKESMDEEQVQTPIQVDNPSGSEPPPPPPPQPSGRDVLTTLSGSICGLAISNDQNMTTFSTSSFYRPWLTVNGNVSEAIKTMVEGISEQPKPNAQKDWVLAFQSNTELTPAYLVKWILIVSEEHAEAIDHSIRNMMKHTWPNKCQILAFQIIKLNSNLIVPYLRNIEHTLQDGKDFHMLFVILSNNRVDLFFAVMDHLQNVDLPAKCIFVNDAISHGLLSVALTNIVDLKKEVGNEGLTWSHMVPLNNLMVVGFDVYKPKGSNISTDAMVSIGADSHFSSTSTHQSQEELSTNFNTKIMNCCCDYKSKKGFLPERIIIFRSGVDGDHLGYIKMTEFLDVLKEFYWSEGKQIPQLSYIVVTNKITNSMLSQQVGHTGPANVPSSSFQQNNVALPLRYHFFLISKIAQKVIKPTSFFVLHDTQGLSPEQMQGIVNQMCHFNFDSSGIVVVPIPCMFAYKMAFLMGLTRGKQAQVDLQHNLAFL